MTGGSIDRFIDATFAVPTRIQAHAYAGHEQRFGWLATCWTCACLGVRWRIDTLVLHASGESRTLYEELGFVVTNDMRYAGDLC